MCIMKKSYFSVLLLLLVAGCGQSPTPVAQAPKRPAVPPPAAAEPAAPADAPPPVPGVVTATPADSGTPSLSNGDDVAFYRSRDSEGKLASDLDVLNNALMAYGTDGKQRPPFKDLSDLVTQGLIKKMPTPPDGKKFVFDPKTAKVTLVSK